MDNLLLLLTTLTLAGFASSIEWNNLHLKFPAAIIDGYWKTPITLKELLNKDNKYTLMVKDTELNVDFYSYPNDPRIALGFDSYGNIAAVRIGFVKADLANKAKKKGVSFDYTYADKPLYSSGTFWNTDVYYTTILFASPEKLASGGRSETDGLVADNFFLKLNGEWTLIPKFECDATDIGFTRQGCFPGMGLHYIYNMSRSLECNNHQGPFLLYEGGALVGLGFFPFGTFTSTSQRTWFEDPPAFLTKIFAPDAPDCFQNWADNYGVTSFHIFLKDHPRFTSCLLGARKSVC